MEDTSALRFPPVAARLIESVRLANSTRRTGARVAADSELSPAQVAREFKVSPATVRRWEKSGILKPTRRLPGSNYRRYSRQAVDELHRKIRAGELDATPETPSTDG